MHFCGGNLKWDAKRLGICSAVEREPLGSLGLRALIERNALVR